MSYQPSQRLKEAVDEYDATFPGCICTSDLWNKFIDKYEEEFLTFGKFVRGIRVVPDGTQTSDTPAHLRVEGVAGIVSMNIEIFRLINRRRG